MWLTFLVSLAGVLSLAIVLYLVELRGKLLAERIDRLVRRSRGEELLGPA